jgi:hypothetical protein
LTFGLWEPLSGNCGANPKKLPKAHINRARTPSFSLSRKNSKDRETIAPQIFTQKDQASGREVFAISRLRRDE